MKVLTNPKVYFDPGRYWIGDLCYVMHDDWNEACDLMIDGNNVKDGGFRLKDGREFAMFSTAWGDGTYLDTEGRGYSVDSGGIGVIHAEDIIDENADVELGNFIEFTKPFIAESVDGVIYFGKVTIDTDPDFDEEEYEDE